MLRVLYPGSFDPLTKGHMNVVEQACELFDEIVIAVLNNNLKKNELFTIEERTNTIREIYKDHTKIKVISSMESSTDVAIKNDCKAIIRGIRNGSDLDYELQIAYMNNAISDNKIKTIVLFPDLEYQFISSTMIRELFRLGKDTSKYVDPLVEQELQKKTRKE